MASCHPDRPNRSNGLCRACDRKVKILTRTPAQVEADRERGRVAAARYYAARPERAIAATRSWQAKNREQVKAARREWRAANKDRHDASQRAWLIANKERVAASKRSYREANREQIAATTRAYRQANKERVAATKRAWSEANKERLAERLRAWKRENKKQVSATEQAWRIANPGAKRALIARRRAAILMRTPTWADQKAIKAIYDEAARLTRETGTEHHVDHVIPLQGRHVSGLHVETNLQILTATANHRKFNRFDVAELAVINF